VTDTKTVTKKDKTTISNKKPKSTKKS